MGLFSQKKKVSAEQMAADMLVVSNAAIGKLKVFDDVDDLHSMAVSLGYFFGFLRLHLNSITRLDTANTIISKSITYVEDATKIDSKFENFGSIVRTTAENATENMKYAIKELRSDPFMGVAVFYLKDLYNSTSLDIGKVDIAASNMRLLYEQTSNITKNIKIVD